MAQILINPVGGQMPTFDPSQPFQPETTSAPSIASGTPTFDPSKPFEHEAASTALKSALTQRAATMMQGAPSNPFENADISQGNYLAAAEQRTSPNIADYAGKLVSNKVLQTDTGQTSYIDPATNQEKLYNPKTQVVLTDPADKTPKIFERSDTTNEGGLKQAFGVARVLAPGLGAGAPAARAGGLVTAASIKPGMVSSADVLATAKPYYQAFDKVAEATPITEDAVPTIIDRLKTAVKKAGQAPANVQPVFNSIENFGSEGNTSVADLRNLKEQLGKDFAKSPEPRIRTASAAASKEISNIIGESVSPEANTALQTADAITAPGKTLQTIEQRANAAETASKAKVFGQSPNEILRGFFTNIIKQMELKRPPGFQGSFMGLKPDELAAVRELSAGSGKLDKVARLAASFAPEKGILRTMFEVTPAVTAAAVGHATTGGASLAGIAGLGVAGDILERVLDARKLGLLKDMIAKRSPEYAAAVKNAVNRLQQSQNALSADPTPNKLGTFVVAARQLASGLNKDGIQITSGDIMRLLQSPVKGAADSNEQPVPGNPPQ